MKILLITISITSFIIGVYSSYSGSSPNCEAHMIARTCSYQEDCCMCASYGCRDDCAGVVSRHFGVPYTQVKRLSFWEDIEESSIGNWRRTTVIADYRNQLHCACVFPQGTKTWEIPQCNSETGCGISHVDWEDLPTYSWWDWPSPHD